MIVSESLMALLLKSHLDINGLPRNRNGYLYHGYFIESCVLEGG
jgi:hypothetical protein